MKAVSVVGVKAGGFPRGVNVDTEFGVPLATAFLQSLLPFSTARGSAVASFGPAAVIAVTAWGEEVGWRRWGRSSVKVVDFSCCRRHGYQLFSSQLRLSPQKALSSTLTVVSKANS